MRAFLTLTALLVGFNAPAQTTFWNPDADGNGLVGAADLLPFLEVFGGSYSATPLYCQDTAVYEAHFVFDPPNGNFSQTQVLTAELAPLVIVTSEGTGPLSSAYMDLILPTADVPDGYVMRILKVDAAGNLDVEIGGQNWTYFDGGSHSSYVFWGDRWFARSTD